MHYRPESWSLVTKGTTIEEQALASATEDIIEVRDAMYDLRLTLIGHIFAKYGCCQVTNGTNILRETEAGAWKRLTSPKRSEMVFSAS